MNGFGMLPTVIRTVAHLRARQVWGQITHALRGYSKPTVDSGLPEFSEGGLPVSFLAPPAHALWQGGDVLELIRTKLDFSTGMDWSHDESGPLWAYHLHNCDHLRVETLSSERRTELILDWIRNHTSGVGWDPHPTSLRLVSWGKLLLSPGALELDEVKRARIAGSMAHQADTLQANLEIRLQANHLLSNLVALVFMGLLFSGPQAERWLAKASSLIDEMALQFNEDGGHEERSPMYHSLLLESLFDLLNLAEARPERAPAGLVDALKGVCARGLNALALCCHPDGDIALFSDSAFEIGPRFEDLVEYAHRLGIEPVTSMTPGVLGSTGFARLESEGFVLIASVAGPSPEHQPGHAHCDALAFELSCGGERVVTGMGVYEYLVGQRRSLSRATLSHATMQVDGAEQSEIWSAHRVGGRPRVCLERYESGHRIEASCASWSSLDSVHHRIFILKDEGLEIRDRLEGRSRPIHLSLPLHPGIKARLVHDQDGGAEAHLILASGRKMRLVLPIEAEWRIETHPYFPRFGEEIQRERLLGEAAAFESGTWRFEWLD